MSCCLGSPCEGVSGEAGRGERKQRLWLMAVNRPGSVLYEIECLLSRIGRDLRAQSAGRTDEASDDIDQE